MCQSFAFALTYLLIIAKNQLTDSYTATKLGFFMQTKRAISLIEIVIFLAILSLLALVMLQSITQNFYADSKIKQKLILKNVTFCKEISENCIFKSQFQEKISFYPIGNP